MSVWPTKRNELSLGKGQKWTNGFLRTANVSRSAPSMTSVLSTSLSPQIGSLLNSSLVPSRWTKAVGYTFIRQMASTRASIRRIADWDTKRYVRKTKKWSAGCKRCRRLSILSETKEISESIWRSGPWSAILTSKQVLSKEGSVGTAMTRSLTTGTERPNSEWKRILSKRKTYLR